jgi:hypothetical protein
MQAVPNAACQAVELHMESLETLGTLRCSHLHGLIRRPSSRRLATCPCDAGDVAFCATPVNFSCSARREQQP